MAWPILLKSLPVRILAGRPFLFASVLAGVATWFGLGFVLLPAQSRAIIAWDVGSLLLVVLYAILFWRREGQHIEADAERQQTGEWTIFWFTLAGVIASFVAIISEFSAVKSASPLAKEARVALVGITLALSWLVAHLLFALRYAHEYYERPANAQSVRGGLDFPDDDQPDYWDFAYFALVLGMTFQVSDVQIKRKDLRRLAVVHGLLSFLFNTVILALTINLAAGLL